MESTKAMPGVFGLIRQSLSFYKKNFKKLASIGAVFIALSVVLSLIFTLFFPGISTGGVALTTLSTGSKVFFVVMTFIAAIINIVAQIVIQIAFAKAAHEYDGDSSASVKDIFKSSFSLFWSFIWLTILSTLIFFGSSVFLIIPALIIGVYTSVAAYTLVVDNKKGLNALTTSFHYVKGNWWRVLGRILGLAVVLLVISLVVAVIVGLILLAFGAISVANMDELSKSVITLAKTLDKSIFVGIVIGIVANFIIYCVVTPICSFYSYSIYKHLKQKKSAPNDTELKTARGWFMGLSIFGLVVSFVLIVLLTLVPLTMGIISGYKGAKMRAEMSNQGTQNPQVTQQESITVPESSIVFPTKSEPLINSNLSSLESKAYSDPDYMFSMRPPMGFITKDIQSGVSFFDPRSKIDAVINVVGRDLTEDMKTTSEMDLVKLIFSKVMAGTKLDNMVFKKLTIGSEIAYAVEGSVLREGQTVNVRYYVLPHGSIFYIIIAASTDNPGELKTLQMVVDSVSTFKAL